MCSRYGNLRFSFNERDFSQRVEQAAVRLGFVTPGLTFAELNDLLHLAVSGEIEEPSSGNWASTSPSLGGPDRTRQPEFRPLAAGSSSAAPGSTSGSRKANWTSPSTRAARPSATFSPTAAPR